MKIKHLLLLISFGTVTYLGCVVLLSYSHHRNSNISFVGQQTNTHGFTYAFVTIHAPSVTQVNSSEHIYEVTLLTHATVCNVWRYLPTMTQRFNGPTVAAVFVRDTHEWAFIHALLSYYRSCEHPILELVTIETVLIDKFDANSLQNGSRQVDAAKFNDNDNDVSSKEKNCTLRYHELAQFCEKGSPNYDHSVIAYPGNLLRNAALNAANSTFVLMVDIDTLPSINLHSFLTQFLVTTEVSVMEKTAFVIPVFEARSLDVHDLPETTNSILDAVADEMVRPFYQEVCPLCQSSSNYPLWLSLSAESPDHPRVYDMVEWHDPYEPFCVASKEANLPRFDTRFMRYGKNRLSQLCEMYMAGWELLGLSSVFLVHVGYKTADSFHSTKNDELDKNRALFQQFGKELRSKYPNASRFC